MPVLLDVVEMEDEVVEVDVHLVRGNGFEGLPADSEPEPGPAGGGEYRKSTSAKAEGMELEVHGGDTGEDDVDEDGAEDIES